MKTKPSRANFNRSRRDYGFFAVAMIGAINFIVPRLFATETKRPLVRLQFWLAAVWVLLMTVPLLASGLVQAVQLASPSVAFTNLIQSSLMFIRISTIGDLCIFTAQLILLLNLLSIMVRFYRSQAVSAYDTLTVEPESAEVAA